MCIACETRRVIGRESKYIKIRHPIVRINMNHIDRDYDSTILVTINKNYNETFELLLNMDFKFIEFACDSLRNTFIIMKPPKEILINYNHVKVG